MRFVKENDIEFFTGRTSASQVSFAQLLRAFARFSLKDFAKALIVQNDDFLDPSVCTHPFNARAPVGDDAKRADNQYLPLLGVRAFDNPEDSGPCREGLSQPDIIGQKKAWIPFFAGAEDLLNGCDLVGSERLVGFSRRLVSFDFQP
jgi:hypothetical protein